jgi:hypothetical protein
LRPALSWAGRKAFQPWWTSCQRGEVVDNEGGFGHQCFHGRLKLPKKRPMFSIFLNCQ